ncbi:hypothetical protein CbuD7D7780_05740 [Coxiella burnetii]|uniref:Uncharacterized protein n=1 Tax=Coxiella burnetii (strain Dugway 5J108-111) TaxID=434922 RepID=A9KCI8_COXBN|nr:hypothetical protein [Coxiella burnetii]ABS76761.2 hypothetical protein CBUD_1114 [Coxiella burnetii Dugway 5J108-111]OYK80261.1 hypothetical protein CbuD7E6568_05720 [Coxiella burnetii]OYK82343.1 hypothetical protein CbuD7D7780_05740 [Coxiella burnetii]
MNKISRYMQNYLLYGFLFVIVLLIWSGFLAHFPSLNVVADSNMLIRILHELLSYNLMFWFLTLLLYMVFLLLIPSIRDKMLRRLANLQERDEREEYITGKAARASYLATLSLTLFFLFFSLININLSKLHQSDPQKPGHSVGISLHYSFFNKSEIKTSPDGKANTVFDLSQFSLSSSTIILIFLGWQLLMFNLAVRRERLKHL